MPLLKRVKQLVSQATFKIGDQERGFGQCVMVEGGFLITAAHCVMRACDAKRPGARQYDEFNAITTDSGTYTARTLAFEPVSDVAILRCPEDQAWAQWCASITPLKVQKQAPKLGAKFDVWIWTHEKNWIAGKAMILADPPASFGIMLDTEIPPGTSGGPLVNETGELVGVVYTCTQPDADEEFIAQAPLLCMALPAWILAEMTASALPPRSVGRR